MKLIKLGQEGERIMEEYGLLASMQELEASELFTLRTHGQVFANPRPM